MRVRFYFPLFVIILIDFAFSEINFNFTWFYFFSCRDLFTFYPNFDFFYIKTAIPTFLPFFLKKDQVGSRTQWMHIPATSSNDGYQSYKEVIIVILLFICNFLLYFISILNFMRNQFVYRFIIVLASYISVW